MSHNDASTDEHASPSQLAPSQLAPSQVAGLRYLPGLDGLRALAVVLVLLFHSQFSWMSGGFLGVSVFFTLSGYLITSLLLAERQSTGAVSLGAFWKRRFRRLLPASLVTIALAIAFALIAGDPTQRAEVGGDAVASMAYVANWWFLFTDQTYGALFAGPSPLLHFWSLAIEEQFYLVLPLVAWLALGRKKLFAVIVGITLLVTTALPFVGNFTDDWLYFATPARLPELLTGVVLALVLTRRTLRDHPNLRDQLATSSARLVPAAVGGVALATIVVLSATSTITSPWLYRGGFAAFSLVSVALIVAVHAPASIVTRALALAPIVHLGRISYGVYLFHWPLFLWLSPQRTGLDGWALFGLRMVVVLTLAELSYRLIETPIRLGRPSGIRWAPIAVAAVVVLGAGGIAVSATAPPPVIDFAAAERNAAERIDANPSPAPLRTTVRPESATEPDTTRIAVHGDSTALMASFGLGFAREDNIELTEGSTLLGCGLARGGQRRFTDGSVDTLPPNCLIWQSAWRERTRADLPDIVMVLVGPWDALDRRMDPNDDFLSAGDPQWDAWFQDDLLAAVDTLSDEGAYVMWLTTPLPNDRLEASNNIANRDGMAHINTIIRQLPELRPGKVDVIDLEEWIEQQGRRDLDLRPDGVHLDEEGATVVAQDFLYPEINRRYGEARQRGDTSSVLNAAIDSWDDLPPLRPTPAGTPDDPLRILVWSDTRAPDVTAAIDRATRSLTPTPTIEVSVVAPPDCGVSRPLRRRGTTQQDQGTTIVDDACRQRSDFTAALDEVKPHLTVIAPGQWEQAELFLWPIINDWTTPIEPTNRQWMLGEFASAVDQARQAGSRVAVMHLGEPAADETPAVPLPWTRRINSLLQAVAVAPARSEWTRITGPRQPFTPTLNWALEQQPG